MKSRRRLSSALILVSALPAAALAQGPAAGRNVGGGANPTVSVSIGGTTYQATDIGTINGTIDFRKVSPYLRVGLAGRASLD